MDKRNLKFIYYLKNNQKPIILSETTDESLESLEVKYKDIFNKKKEHTPYVLKTKTDILITKHSNITAVLISTSDKHLFENDKINEDKSLNNEYKDKLRIS